MGNRVESRIPEEPGYYRVRVLDNNAIRWVPASVFYRGNELVFSTTVPGFGVHSLDSTMVCEWGSEIEVCEFEVLMSRLEALVDHVSRDGTIGRFRGVSVTERFTKKALMGVIVECQRWGSRAMGGGSEHVAFKPAVDMEDDKLDE